MGATSSILEVNGTTNNSEIGLLFFKSPSTPNPPYAFAIMRNAHESIRKCLEALLSLEKTPEYSLEDFQSIWYSYRRAIDTHAAMEDLYMFPHFDHMTNGAITKELIPEEHKLDITLSEEISRVLNDGGKVDHMTLDRYVESMMHHLQHEEKLLLPMTVKVGSTNEERCVMVHKYLIEPSYDRNPEEFGWYVGWCVEQLNNYGSTANPPNVAVRVFVHSLHATTTPSQWRALLPVIRSKCSAEIYDEMVRDYYIDQDGRIEMAEVAALKDALQCVATPETPNPVYAFATMRNAHESLRKCLATLVSLETKPDYSLEELKLTWNSYRRAMDVHAFMEDHFLFPLLDQRSDGAITKELIPEEHKLDITLSEEISKVLNEGGKVDHATLDRYVESMMHHLQHEEKVMMPITVKVGSTNEERCVMVHKYLIGPSYDRNPEEFGWYVGWCVEQLNNYGSTANPPNVAVRVFVHSLHATTTPSQWRALLPVIRSKCSAEIYDEMVRDYYIDRDGRIV